MSDESVKVYENEQITWKHWKTGVTKKRVKFNGPPGRYVRVEDVARLVEDAYREGHKEISRASWADKAWKQSKAAARIRAMKGE